MRSSARFWKVRRFFRRKPATLLQRNLTTGTNTENVRLKVNGVEVSVPSGTSILDACKIAKAYVPSLCYHPMLPIAGTCRLCLVEVKKQGKLLPACANVVENGMEVLTDTDKTTESVKSNLALLRCRHPNVCMTCEVTGQYDSCRRETGCRKHSHACFRSCEFQKLVGRYQVEELLPQHENRSSLKDASSNSLIRDMSKCVMCTRCVRACSSVQGMNILGIADRGWGAHVTTVADLPINQTACISCGQCTAVCPVGALIEKPHIHHVQRGLKNKSGKIWVAHTAPAVRVAISEEFGMAPGTVSTGKLVNALKEVGFDYVFDTNFAADLTIVEEAHEFLTRLQHGDSLPMFTSCCPGWINLIEKSYPEARRHLSTCKSPQGMMGALIKTYFAKKINRAPEDIVVVSIMPCVAKKDERARQQLTMQVNTDGGSKKIPETDYVLTTREIGHLLQNENIPLASMPETAYDDPLGLTTGAAALFAVTGGVMEAALRTAAEVVTGQTLQKLDFNAVRGINNLREATVQVGDVSLNVAVATGMATVRKIVEQVLAGESKYHFIEVMACPGGCIGGGGEPKNTTLDKDILKKRAEAVYKLDRGMALRKSHENPAVKELYSEFLQNVPNSHKSHELLHTYYRDRSSEVLARSDTPFGLQPGIEDANQHKKH